MNKKVKQSIISIVLTVLVVIISLLTYHYVHKNFFNYNNVNENINVTVDTNKEVTKVSINNENTLIEKYTININTDKFYHYKMVLDNSNDVSYIIKRNNEEIVSETSIISGTNTIYEGEFTEYTENYEVIIKINNYDETSYENKIYFVY